MCTPALSARHGTGYIIVRASAMDLTHRSLSALRTLPFDMRPLFLGGGFARRPSLIGDRSHGLPRLGIVLRRIPKHPSGGAPSLGMRDFVGNVLRAERGRVIAHSLDPRAHQHLGPRGTLVKKSE